MNTEKKSKMQKTGRVSNSLWGGRFSAKPSEIMQAINASIFFDSRFYAEDIRASKAHVEMLGQQGIVTKGEAKKIVAGLNKIQKEIEKGDFALDPALEDIHMHVEARLTELIGSVAGKLHTARSRNDQAVTDFRLWVREAIDKIDTALQNFQRALLDQAEAHTETILPGFTHLQTAQPVTLGHHLMAYVEMVGRDRSRFQDCRKRLNESPLGAAALAGTPYPIDRNQTAKALGFDRPMKNSMDAVSDRDFALDYLSALAITGTHLSRLAEEIILWASAPFSFITLSDRLSTGSSIMPQKRNPDAAELARAKTGRINGALIALLTVMKGLPLAYSKDMQEDKEPVFDATDSIELSLAAMTAMIADLDVNQEPMLKAARAGYSTATDLADWLVRELDMPFRQAHHVTGRIVKRAEQKGCRLDELLLSDMQAVDGGIHKGVYSVLSVEKSVKSRKSFGGTAPVKVRAAIRAARKEFL